MSNTMAFLYKWTQHSTGMWYIGSRTARNCHPNDGYICSSKVVKPLIKETPRDWNREILVIGEPLYIRELENKILSKLDAANDAMSYNKTNADGIFVGAPHSEETKNKLRKAFLGSKHSEKTKNLFSANRTGEKNPFFGKKHSLETKQKLRKMFLGSTHTEKTREKISKSQLGRARLESHKIAISDGIKKLDKKSCENCFGLFSPALYGRWHGINCRFKKDSINE